MSTMPEKLGAVSRVGRLCAVFSMVLGLTVMAGWYGHISWMIQVLPTFVPMQFNTALGFTCLGIALWYLHDDRYRWAGLFALPALLLGGLTLFEYLADTSIGLDELFMIHYITVHTPNPGRMAPNTALCFCLAAIAVHIVQVIPVSRFNWVMVTVTTLAALVLGLGGIALFGYATGLVPTFGWGKMTQMAVHTATGFCWVGFSLLLYGYRQIGARQDFRHWLFAMLVPLVLTLMSCLQLALSAEKEQELRDELLVQADGFQADMERQLGVLSRAIAHMGDRWLVTKGMPAAIWQHDAFTYYRDFHVFQSVAWVQADQSIGWIYPQLGGTQKESVTAKLSGVWGVQLQIARNMRTHYSPVMAAMDEQRGMLLLRPLSLDDYFGGWILAVVDLDEFIQPFAERASYLGLRLQIQQSDGEVIYQSEGFASSLPMLMTGLPVSLSGQQWSVSISAGPGFVAARTTPVNTVATTLVLLLVILSLVLVYQLLRLRDQEHRIADLGEIQTIAFDTMMDGLVVTSDSGVIRQANQAFLDIFGYTEQELNGMPIAGLMPEPIRSEYSEYLRQFSPARESRRIGHSRVLRACRKNGEQFPISIRVSMSDYQGEQFFTGVIHDLSDQLLSEQIRAEKEALLNVAMSSSASGVAITTIDGHFADVNRALYQWLGYTHKEMIGMHVSEITPAPERENMATIMTELKEHKRHSVHFEKQCLKRDGARTWSLVSIGVVDDQYQVAQYFVFNFVDIEEQKQLSYTLEQHNQQLEAMNAELEQFAYIASHDLKEPLRTIRNFCTYLHEDLEHQDRQRVDQDIRFVLDATDRMAKLIDALLQLSQAGRDELEQESVDLIDCVYEAKDHLYAAIEDTQAQLHIIEPLPQVQGDRRLLAQAFQNLIANAIKFQPEGAIPQITIRAHQTSSGWHCILVIDNGIGIAEEHLPDIFTGLRKLHSDKQYPGHGMGLAIIRKIVARHGGRVDVMSRLGEGTTFSIMLPPLDTEA